MLLASGALAQPVGRPAHVAANLPNGSLVDGKVDIKSGTVKVVRGEVSATNAQGRRLLKPGDAVTVNDRVVTGPDAAVSVVLRDGTTLMVGPGSRLEISGFTYDPTTQKGNLLLSLLRGSMRMITGLIGKTQPEAVRITTPTSIIGVLGTDFIVEADGAAP